MSTPDVAAQHFMQMSDVLLPPPFPLLISLLLVIGMLHLSCRGARWLAGDNARPVEHAAAFVFTTGLCRCCSPCLGLGRICVDTDFAGYRMGAGCFGTF